MNNNNSLAVNTTKQIFDDLPDGFAALAVISALMFTMIICCIVWMASPRALCNCIRCCCCSCRKNFKMMRRGLEAVLIQHGDSGVEMEE